MGAWIETIVYVIGNHISHGVAPLVGAWIETLLYPIFVNQWSVAPLVGAWIETSSLNFKSDTYGSRTPRGCVD